MLHSHFAFSVQLQFTFYSVFLKMLSLRGRVS